MALTFNRSSDYLIPSTTILLFLAFICVIYETSAASPAVEGSRCKNSGECEHSRTALICLTHCVCPGTVTLDELHGKRLLARFDREKRKCIAGFNTICYNRTALNVQHHTTTLQCEPTLYCEPFKQDPVFGFCTDGTISSSGEILMSSKSTMTTMISLMLLLLITIQLANFACLM